MAYIAFVLRILRNVATKIDGEIISKQFGELFNIEQSTFGCARLKVLWNVLSFTRGRPTRPT